jgi:hypothetical protein
MRPMPSEARPEKSVYVLGRLFGKIIWEDILLGRLAYLGIYF